MAELIVNRRDFARIIGRSPTHVGHLMEQGLPHEGHGRGSPVRIPVAAALQWYLGFLEQQGQGDERRALVREQVRYLKLRNGNTESRLITSTEARQVLGCCATIYEGELERGSERLIKAFPDRARQIRSEIARIRGETAGKLRGYADKLKEETDA